MTPEKLPQKVDANAMSPWDMVGGDAFCVHHPYCRHWPASHTGSLGGEVNQWQVKFRKQADFIQNLRGMDFWPGICLLNPWIRVHWVHSIQKRIRITIKNELGLEEIECQKELQSRERITSTHGSPPNCLHSHSPILSCRTVFKH